MEFTLKIGDDTGQRNVCVLQFVELHGGKVEVASEGPGKGTQYTVRLPMVAASAPIAEADGLAKIVVDRTTPNNS